EVPRLGVRDQGVRVLGNGVVERRDPADHSEEREAVRDEAAQPDARPQELAVLWPDHIPLRVANQRVRAVVDEGGAREKAPTPARVEAVLEVVEVSVGLRLEVVVASLVAEPPLEQPAPRTERDASPPANGAAIERKILRRQVRRLADADVARVEIGAQRTLR